MSNARTEGLPPVDDRAAAFKNLREFARDLWRNREREKYDLIALIDAAEKAACIVLALLILTAGEPRLFACFKSKGLSSELSKKQCISRGGRWLPKGDDMPMGTRA